MSREYAPLGRGSSVFQPLEDGDYAGYTTAEPGIVGSPDPSGPDDIPLITSRSHQTKSPDSSYDSGRYQALSPEVSHDSSRTWSGQSASTIRRKPVHSTSSFQNVRKSFLSSSFHKDVSDSSHPYARYYNFRRTRDKLFVRGFKQWLISALFAGAIAGVLAAYHVRETISSGQKHIFNAIITGLSIFLGMNLASSLKKYAELMRWRLVTVSWLSLREFDLVLQCGSMTKVFALFMESRKKKFPFVSLIQLICLTWVAFNVIAQILVAMVGLTYSLDQANSDILVPGGTVSIVDLSTIRDLYGSGNGQIAGQLASAHAYGIQGQDFGISSSADPTADSYKSSNTLYTDTQYSYFLYRFLDINPETPGLNQAMVSSVRTVTTNATCIAYDVTDIGDAFYTDPETKITTSIPGAEVYFNDGSTNTSIYVPEFAYGAVTWLSYFNSNNPCGPRCNQVVGFQAVSQKYSPNQQLEIPQSTIYVCNSYVSEVADLTDQGKAYALQDKEAQYIAGAIGWTGYFSPLAPGVYNDFQYLLYSNDSYWSPPYTMLASGVNSAAMFVSEFAASVLGAMDNNGPRANITDGLQPQLALSVTVQWNYTIPLLAGIVGMQMVALLLVILWANKAVVVDESYLSIAKLLAPTVQKLGDHGSVLRGEEIADGINESLGGHHQVFYGCQVKRNESGDSIANRRDSETGTIYTTQSNGLGGTILKADIIERGQGIMPMKHRPFSDGTYD